ncbi:MAG: FAD-dependent oxidoreductase [Patescibacteria group bacterium]|mgnify:CR=1 FL=1
MFYDLIIIGGGPAAVAAGVYAARKKIKTTTVAFDFGGQSIVSSDIQNWIGTKSISGEKLAADLKDHLESYRSADFVIKEGVKAETVTPSGANFKIRTDDQQEIEARTVLIATGAHRRKLTVPGATEFEQKGITYCATCDGPLFAGKDVIVIGGGNAAFETALQLLAYAQSVTLIHRSETYRADELTVERVLAHPKFKAITNAETQEIKGDKFVTSLVYKNVVTGEVKEIATGGIFVEIGLVPSTEMVKDLVDVNQYGAIVVDTKTQKTSHVGIWAAGDCADGLYHQNNIAVGDAIKALEDIYLFLHLTN